MQYLSEADTERFWNNVDKREEQECWPWQGSSGTAPMIRIDGKNISAMKVMWDIHYGEWPEEGKSILRTCGTQGHACINPHHMVLVKRGANYKSWYRKQMKEMREDIHSLAGLVGMMLLRSESGHYTVHRI